MQTVVSTSMISTAVLWLIVALTAVGSGLHVVSADDPNDGPAAGDFDRPLRRGAALPPMIMIARLRAAVQRIEKLADEVDAVLGLVEADIEKDDLLTADAPAGPSDAVSGTVLQQLIDEKRAKTSGPTTATAKTGRRYESFGVAGRFGRSVDRQ
jgi:hypothetical protein